MTSSFCHIFVVLSPSLFCHWNISTVLHCQFQSSLHHGLFFLITVHRVFFSGWIFIVSLSSLQAAFSTCFDYRTAWCLPCGFSKHAFLILFHFRNKHLLDVHLILLCYKWAFLYNRCFTQCFTVPISVAFSPC